MITSTSAQQNLISVIVPTHNRAAKLPQCLVALQSAALPDGVDCEIICIDNNSTDDTRCVIEEQMARPSLTTLKYVFERHQGASSARNAGLREARGAVIAMTDDDCIVACDWLQSIWREFQAAPNLGLLGGRVELHDSNDLPISIRTSRERKILSRESAFNLIPSCNMALRRSVIDAVGTFDIDLGPGTRLGAGEDTDFVHRTVIAGFPILYTPDVLIYHAHGRRSEGDRTKLEKVYFASRGAVYFKYALRLDLVVIRIAYWEIAKLVKEVLRNAMARQSSARELWVLRLFALGGFLYVGARIRRLIAGAT